MKIKTLIILLAFNFICLAQNQGTVIKRKYSKLNNRNLGDTKFISSMSKIKSNKKIDFNIGFQAGLHSSNLKNNRSNNFNEGIFGEFYSGFALSNEVEVIIAFIYWKAQKKELNIFSGNMSTKTITSKGIKFEIDFGLLKFHNIKLILGPSIAYENITTANTAVFSFGTNLKLKLPLWASKINLLSTINFQTGAEIFEFGGGGIGYSFLNYLLGIEYKIEH